MRRMLILLLLCVWAGGVTAIEIKRVHHEPLRIDPAQREVVSVHFHLTSPAEVELRIYDGREYLVRRITSPGRLDSGDRTLRWDGTDEAGRPVPADAYHYTLWARDVAGNEVIHDLTDITGGDDVFAADVHWDPVLQRIEYQLHTAARVSVRLWLKDGGPYLGTLVDWAPRLGGRNSESWDGRDASNVMDLSAHPSLDVMVRAYALSDNSILVGAPEREGRWVEGITWEPESRPMTRVGRPRMVDYGRQSMETRGDLGLELRIAADVALNDVGLPVIAGQVPLRLDVAGERPPHLTARRLMTVFFIDGQFVYQNKTGFLPMTWYWDSRGTNRGVHYITANVYGYEGNLGAATLKVYVDPTPLTAARED